MKFGMVRSLLQVSWVAFKL